MTYDTMTKDGRTYYRAQCDYPGCGAKYEGAEYDYWETPDLAAEDATSMDMWLAMTDRNGDGPLLLSEAPTVGRTRVHARLQIR